MMLFSFVLANESVVKQQLVQLVNNDRYARGLQPVCGQSNLDLAASKHSNEMAASQIMAHESSSFGTPWQRMKQASYSGFSRSENILKTPMSDSNDIQFANHLYMLWKTSPDHWKNIVDPSVNKMGFSYRKNGQFTFATQNFGVGGQACGTPVKFNPMKRIFNRVTNPVTSAAKNAWSWLTGKKTAEQLEKEKFQRLKEDKDSSIRKEKERKAWLFKLFQKKKDKEDETKKAEDKKKAEAKKSEDDIENNHKTDLKPFFGAVDSEFLDNPFAETDLSKSEEPNEVDIDSDFANHLSEMNQEVIALGSKTDAINEATAVESERAAEAEQTTEFSEYLDTVAEDMSQLGTKSKQAKSLNEDTSAIDAISPIGDSQNTTNSPFTQVDEFTDVKPSKTKISSAADDLNLK